jgi:hypothetical protein
MQAKRIYIAPKLEEQDGVVAGTLGKIFFRIEGGHPPFLF